MTFELMKRAKKGNIEIVKYLVENGADIDWTVLMLANFQGHIEVAEYLKSKG